MMRSARIVAIIIKAWLRGFGAAMNRRLGQPAAHSRRFTSSNSWIAASIWSSLSSRVPVIRRAAIVYSVRGVVY